MQLGVIAELAVEVLAPGGDSSIGAECQAVRGAGGEVDRQLAEVEQSSSYPSRRSVDEGRIIATSPSEQRVEGANAVLEHPTLQVITYPYEWTFSMLRDAALLQLDLLSEALPVTTEVLTRS